MPKLLAVFAHPDDESFGPGATLAKYGKSGVEVHILMATKGEAGQNHAIKNRDKKISEIRKQEAINASKILGAKKIEFLGFIDGELKQNNYHKLAEKIIEKINSFKPDVIMTFENRGISGHIDHVVMSMTTTYAYLKTKIAKKLYYYCLPDYFRKNKTIDDYFIYFPEGFTKNQITTKINISEFWETKVKAMKIHQSQTADIKRILKDYKDKPRIEHFILKYSSVNTNLPESDFFSGIK